jgi:hypothetical protein
VAESSHHSRAPPLHPDSGRASLPDGSWGGNRFPERWRPQAGAKARRGRRAGPHPPAPGAPSPGRGPRSSAASLPRLAGLGAWLPQDPAQRARTRRTWPRWHRTAPHRTAPPARRGRSPPSGPPPSCGRRPAGLCAPRRGLNKGLCGAAREKPLGAARAGGSRPRPETTLSPGRGGPAIWGLRRRRHGEKCAQV